MWKFSHSVDAEAITVCGDWLAFPPHAVEMVLRQDEMLEKEEGRQLCHFNCKFMATEQERTCDSWRVNNSPNRHSIVNKRSSYRSLLTKDHGRGDDEPPKANSKRNRNEWAFLPVAPVSKCPPQTSPFNSISLNHNEYNKAMTRMWMVFPFTATLSGPTQRTHIKWEAVLEIGFLRVIYKTTAKPFSPPSNSLSWLSSPERTRAAAAGGSRRNRRTQRTHNRMRGWM